MLLAFLPVLFGTPYQALMPAVAASIHGVDAGALGVLMTANGLGALAGSLGLAALGGRADLARLQRITGLLMGGGLVAFALCGAFAAAIALVALVGGAWAAYASVNNTLLLGVTPPNYLGRVMGVYMLTYAAMSLSSLPAAWVADAIGLPAALTLCGAITAGSVAALSRMVPPSR
jgi:hypothetical protein